MERGYKPKMASYAPEMFAKAFATLDSVLCKSKKTLKRNIVWGEISASNLQEMWIVVLPVSSRITEDEE